VRGRLPRAAGAGPREQLESSPELALKGAFWQWVSQININTLGFVIVATFVLTWRSLC
jgi:high-affinity nickel permease